MIVSRKKALDSYHEARCLATSNHQAGLTCRVPKDWATIFRRFGEVASIDMSLGSASWDWDQGPGPPWLGW